MRRILFPTKQFSDSLVWLRTLPAQVKNLFPANLTYLRGMIPGKPGTKNSAYFDRVLVANTE